MILKPYLEKCIAGEHLTRSEASAALEAIMTNQATDVEISGILVALRSKGETVDEIVGFAGTMREHAVRIHADDPDTVDMCGTGGDGLGTFNISTVAALVVAGAGATVAKHGNRSVSSRSGSADLLEALGVNIQCQPPGVERCLNTIGIGFLFAPMFHPAMKFAGKARSELGVRTIFNILGPLTSPAGVLRQVVGTYSLDIANLLAESLGRLGTKRACVLHAKDGMDEVSLSAETDVIDVAPGEPPRHSVLSPAHFELPTSAVGSARGGDVAENARIARSILTGEKIAARDLVVANAALALVVAGKCSSLSEAARRAAESIDSGRAMEKLERLTEFTHRS